MNQSETATVVRQIFTAASGRGYGVQARQLLESLGLDRHLGDTAEVTAHVTGTVRVRVTPGQEPTQTDVLRALQQAVSDGTAVVEWTVVTPAESEPTEVPATA